MKDGHGDGDDDGDGVGVGVGVEDTQNIRQFKSQNWQFILYELTK